MGFVYLFLYFLVVDNAITLFNCFFRDFRGFRDFRVFDLVHFKQNTMWKVNVMCWKFYANKHY